MDPINSVHNPLTMQSGSRAQYTDPLIDKTHMMEHFSQKNKKNEGNTGGLDAQNAIQTYT